MAVRWAVSSSNWSDVNTWNDGATLGIPVAADSVYANNRNITIDQSFEVFGLRNLALARDIATPAMTANNAPSPYVAAASSTQAGFDAFNAFNRVYTAGTGWATATFVTTGWLSMDFGSSVVIDGYTIFGRETQTSNPRNWTLESSNDNVNWTIRHTVSGAAAIAASSTYSVASIGNTTGSRYYRLNISLNGGGTVLSIAELELYQPGTAALAAGGSFIFNSGSISGSATSTTTALIAGATNLIQVTATTGSVGLTLGGAVTAPAITSLVLISHTGNCDFNLSGSSFTPGSGAGGVVCINKTSAGTITVRANINGGSASGANVQGLVSSNGNTVIIGNLTSQGSAGGGGHALNQSTDNVTVTGNVIGATGGSTQPNHGINLTGATSILTIIGNVVGGAVASNLGVNLTGAASQFTIVGNITGGTSTSAFGISHSGTSGSVIGNVTGGSGATAHGISTVGAVTVTGTVTGGAGTTARGINTTNALSVTGNVIGGAGAGAEGINNASGITTAIGNVTGGANGWGIGAPSTNAINVTGTVTAASGTATGGVYQTGGGVVNLTGNMINVSGRQAIFSQNLFISNAATSQWRLFTQGGQDKTLYSADTFPNQPTSANVRSGSLFGPANALSGSMVVPVPSDVRVNVLTDNTVGTGQSLTAADFLAAISSSVDPFAERLRNVATVDTVGLLVTGLNGGF